MREKELASEENKCKQSKVKSKSKENIPDNNNKPKQRTK